MCRPAHQRVGEDRAALRRKVQPLSRLHRRLERARHAGPRLEIVVDAIARDEIVGLRATRIAQPDRVADGHDLLGGVVVGDRVADHHGLVALDRRRLALEDEFLRLGVEHDPPTLVLHLPVSPAVEQLAHDGVGRIPRKIEDHLLAAPRIRRRLRLVAARRPPSSGPYRRLRRQRHFDLHRPLGLVGGCVAVVGGCCARSVPARRAPQHRRAQDRDRECAERPSPDHRTTSPHFTARLSRCACRGAT